MLIFDKNSIVAEIARSGLTMKDCAKYLNISANSFSNKINNKTEFKASELAKLATLFKVSPNIFFRCKVVQNTINI